MINGCCVDVAFSVADLSLWDLGVWLSYSAAKILV